MKTIVTTGEKFTDIDALACAVAYAELLQKLGRESVVVLPGVLNHSVTDSIKRQLGTVQTSYELKEGDKVVIVDVSDPNEFALFVSPESVVEVIDHHHGFEDFWKERLGENSRIEMIGAAATLVYEAWVRAGKEKEMSILSARLLLHAIVSNTLNFNVGITNDRDKLAYNELLVIAALPANWVETYFNEQDAYAFTNVRETIFNDTKKIVGNLPDVFGQLELWNGAAFIANHKADIEFVMNSIESEAWLMSIPSISEGKNYLYTKSAEVQILLQKALGVSFLDNIATTDRLLLRKEIRKILVEVLEK